MMTPTRLSDYVARALVDAGAGSFFMVSGGMMMHLMDAFGRTKLPYYCNHHEQASAMGADGFARASGRIGLCLATSGPGATNLITGIAGAYQDSIPIVFITGQNKVKETTRASGISGLRQAGVFEIDIIPIVESITKYAAFVDSPSDVRFHVEKALYLAQSGRPGPVLLDIPLDVQAASIIPGELKGFTPPLGNETSPEIEQQCRQILNQIRSAKRPLIFAGNGVRISGQVAIFHQLKNLLSVPVVTSMLGKDLLPHSDEQLVGQIGTRGHRGANFAVQSADFILAMGCSFHIQSAGYEKELFAPEATVVQIDPDPATLERDQAISDVRIQGTLQDYLPALLRTAANQPVVDLDAAWLNFCDEAKNRYSSRNEPHALGSASDPCNLYEFMFFLSDLMKGDEIVMTDAGQPTYVVPQGLDLKGTQRFLVPGSFAGMGWALPAALGAASAEPERNVVLILGDGSLQTNLQELQTIAHHKSNIKIFIINNDGYASIRNTQSNFFDGFFVGSTPGSGVTLPPLPKVADAFGIPYLFCPDRSSLNDSIALALSRTGPVICEVMNRRDQKVVPTVPSYRLPDGTMKSRAIDEMVPDIGIDLRTFQREFLTDSN